MKLGHFRKMRLVNLIVCLAFCLNLGLSANALASVRVEKASASMLRPEAALGHVKDIAFETLKIINAKGPKELEKALADIALSKTTDPLVQTLIENNVIVVKKGEQTFIVCLTDKGWYAELVKEGELKKVPFASEKEKSDFMNDPHVQRLWVSIMMDATPNQIHEAEIATNNYIRKAGEEGRIFTEANLAKEVEAYAKGKKLSPEAKDALLKRLQAVIDFRKRAIESLTLEEALDFFIEGDIATRANLPALLDKIKRDLSDDLAIRKAIIYDESGDPVFTLIGNPLDFEYLAVTASSGTGFVFPGYKGYFPRSTFEILGMTESYMEMEKAGDQDALKAYKAKNLFHEYVLVDSKSKELRRETQKVRDLIESYDDKAITKWVEREIAKINTRILNEENKKTIAEATSANIGKFLKGGVVSSELIAVAEAELQKLVESKLLTGYRIVIKGGQVSILTTRQNSKVFEESANIPSKILNVYLSVLNAAKDENIKVGDYLIYVGENLTGKTYRQQTDALEISAPLPTLTYLEPEGWAKNFFAKKIRTELTVPEGQPKGFFTGIYHGYTIGELFAKPLEQIPDAVVNAVRAKLDQDIAQGKILSAEVRDFGATDIDVLVTHRYGQLNATVHRLLLEAIKEGVLKAKELGLLREDVNVASMSLEDLGKELRVKEKEHSITERGSEPIEIIKMIGAGIGASNIKNYHQFFIPGSTPLQKLGYLPKGKAGPRGWRSIVRRFEDVLKGNYDGPVWECEMSAAFEDTKGKQYPSVDESKQLLVPAGAPNDFLITEIWPVEGSALPSTEPVVSVVYQPVYGEKGELRTLNPTFISRTQSGADAVGGAAGIFDDVNFVPGGHNGEHFVATKPVTLEEARKAPPEGIAYVAIWGWQFEGGGFIPTEEGTRIDHIEINPPAVNVERELADELASIMMTWPNDQPYLTPFAAEERVAPLRKAQRHLFERAPRETDPDPRMDKVEAKIASGEYLSFADDKADMGGLFGHNFTPSYMLAIDVATAIEAIERGTLTDGNIIGFIEKMRLKKGLIYDIGDDEHILMLGDKTRNAAQSHQLSFLMFTRGYLASVLGNEKVAPRPKGIYGRGQDFAGKEAKAAMANPYFYSQFSERFFEILREVMPEDHMNMVDLMHEGWIKWQQTSKETTALLESFSGNVSHQGIGTARYLVDIKGGERTVGILAGDKMGPAALNIPITEGVYALLDAIEKGTASVPEWIKYVTLTESQVKKVGLDWNNVLKKFTENGWAKEVRDAGTAMIRFIPDWEAARDSMSKVFGDDFLKISPILEESKKERQREYDYLSSLLVKFKNGFVFEIWDAKAFDEHGNIAIDELPAYTDVEEYLSSLAEKSEQDFIKGSYNADGSLRDDLTLNDKEKLAELIKKAGFVPTKRIYLDAKEDKEAVSLYRADSDRFNFKQVWDKVKPGWDINNPQEYLDKPILGSSVTKLGIIAGGNYIGKDDPVMVANILLMEHIFEFFKLYPHLIIQGDMNGSHWLSAVPTASKYAVATKDSHPILVGFRYGLSDDGAKLAKVEDVFGSEDYDSVRDKVFRFNREFKLACLGGQFEPYGTNWRTVEAAYAARQAMEDFLKPDNPLLIKNKSPESRKTRPIGEISQVPELFKTATRSLEIPAASEGWTGADESAQRFWQSALAKQGAAFSQKHSEDVFDTSKKGSADPQVVLVSLSQLRKDPSLIKALASSNEQRNRRLGIFGSTANIGIDAYRIIGIADDLELEIAQDVEDFFADSAKETKNGAKGNKEMFAKIMTQEDMLEGNISNPADLVKQLKRDGIKPESLKGFVGAKEWTTKMKAQSGVFEKAIAMGVDAEGNKIAFAGNGLFGVIETIAARAHSKELASEMREKLDLLVTEPTSMEVKPREISTEVADVIYSYRKQMGV